MTLRDLQFRVRYWGLLNILLILQNQDFWLYLNSHAISRLGMVFGKESQLTVKLAGWYMYKHAYLHEYHNIKLYIRNTCIISWELVSLQKLGHLPLMQTHEANSVNVKYKTKNWAVSPESLNGPNWVHANSDDTLHGSFKLSYIEIWIFILTVWVSTHKWQYSVKPYFIFQLHLLLIQNLYYCS